MTFCISVSALPVLLWLTLLCVSLSLSLFLPLSTPPHPIPLLSLILSFFFRWWKTSGSSYKRWNRIKNNDPLRRCCPVIYCTCPLRHSLSLSALWRPGWRCVCVCVCVCPYQALCNVLTHHGLWLSLVRYLPVYLCFEFLNMKRNQRGLWITAVTWTVSSQSLSILCRHCVI